MKSFVVPLVLACASLGSASSGAAITLDVDPASQAASVGDAVSVSVRISGLGSGSSPSLSTFDLNVTYDPEVLEIDTTDADGDGVIDSIVLDPSGELDLFGLDLNVVFADSSGAGVVTLYELSLDLPSDLELLQSDSFPLAELVFTAKAAGDSPIDPSVNSLGDEQGEPLVADIENGSVSVEASGGYAPEPIPAVSAWGLVLLSLLLPGIAVFAQRRR